MTEGEITTWHHGLVARWWAEFNAGGDDVDVFVEAIRRGGGPGLDAGCGTGRLLLPCLRAGLDVDGSDAAPDMLAWCRQAADAEGFSVQLYPLAMHQLDLPRRYRTIVVCGAFGLGGTRAQDLAGLERLHATLEPGGALLLDHYLPNLENPRSWTFWSERPELPRRWPSRGDRRTCGDGTELELLTRLKDIDPLEQRATLEMRANHYVAGEVVTTETSEILIGMYLKNEIELMLDVAGFSNVSVSAFGESRAPVPWQDARILFQATA